MAVKLQRPLPDEALGIVAKGEKEDGPSALAGLGARGKRLPPAAVTSALARVYAAAWTRLTRLSAAPWVSACAPRESQTWTMVMSMK